MTSTPRRRTVRSVLANQALRLLPVASPFMADDARAAQRERLARLLALFKPGTCRVAKDDAPEALALCHALVVAAADALAHAGQPDAEAADRCRHELACELAVMHAKTP